MRWRNLKERISRRRAITGWLLLVGGLIWPLIVVGWRVLDYASRIEFAVSSFGGRSIKLADLSSDVIRLIVVVVGLIWIAVVASRPEKQRKVYDERRGDIENRYNLLNLLEREALRQLNIRGKMTEQDMQRYLTDNGLLGPPRDVLPEIDRKTGFLAQQFPGQWFLRANDKDVLLEYLWPDYTAEIPKENKKPSIWKRWWRSISA